MPCRNRLPRWLSIAASALVATSCTSSSSTTSVTTPASPSSRCAAALSADAMSIGASGGGGRVTIEINRECEWTAKAEVNWISLTSEATGHGDASVNYTIAANPIVGERRGGIAVNDQRLEITQAAAPCTFTLNGSSQSMDAMGGRHSVAVSAQAPCRWTATSQASWIAIAAGDSGTGNGTVTLAVSANGTEPRSGTVLIAGQTFTIAQLGTPAQPVPGPPPSPPAPTPPAPAPPAPTPPAPTPPAPAPPAPAPPPPAPPPPAPPCTFSLSVTTQSVPATGGQRQVGVTASTQTCAWTATTSTSWIAITAGAAGTGNGQTTYSVSANISLSSRTGTVTVAGKSVTVSQAAFVPEPINLNGRVSALSGSCPSRTFTLEGRTIRTNGATDFRKGNCSQLDNGDRVEVDGLVQADASVLATRVTFDDDDDDDDDDD